MRLTFHEGAWDDYVYWATTDRKMLKRLNRLLEDIQRDPFDGIGKPEQLSHDFAGWWSRRIDEEHRIVYTVEGDQLVILQARGHYGD